MDNSKFKKRNGNKNNRRNNSRNNGNYRNTQRVDIKKLDMRKNDEFNHMLGNIVNDLPDGVRGAIKGSIYSIISKQGTKEAKEFIAKKKYDGVISGQMEKDLINLIYDYSKGHGIH